MSTPNRIHSTVQPYLPTPPDSSSRAPPILRQQHSFTTTNNVRDHYINYTTTRVKRRRRLLRDSLPTAINKPVIRRLARRGGVRRIQMTIYETVQQVVRARLEKILEHAIAICEHTERKTLTNLDVVYALRVLGSPIYGFGSVVKGENVHSRARYARERKARNLRAAREYAARLEREQQEQEEEDRVRQMRENRNRAVDAMARAMRMGARGW